MMWSFCLFQFVVYKIWFMSYLRVPDASEMFFITGFIHSTYIKTEKIGVGRQSNA